ncbi:MAG: hypothetical protein V1492_04355 [Candidatus Micrarchaeota archaeon]
MKCEKIEGIQNLDDSVWFRIKGTTQAIKILTEIFNIGHITNHQIYDAENNEREYNDIVEGSGMFAESTEEFSVYFSYTVNQINVVLLKTKNFGKYEKELFERFGWAE